MHLLSHRQEDYIPRLRDHDPASALARARDCGGCHSTRLRAEDELAIRGFHTRLDSDRPWPKLPTKTCRLP